MGFFWYEGISMKFLVIPGSFKHCHKNWLSFVKKKWTLGDPVWKFLNIRLVINEAKSLLWCTIVLPIYSSQVVCYFGKKTTRSLNNDLGLKIPLELHHKSVNTNTTWILRQYSLSWTIHNRLKTNLTYKWKKHLMMSET